VEQSLLESLDKAFHNNNRIKRRKPDKYMQNPTKVYFTQYGSSNFAMYDLPGYNQSLISRNTMADTLRTTF
jgi:hypothetical protein